MSLLIAILIVALVAAVVLVVSAPLRSARNRRDQAPSARAPSGFASGAAAEWESGEERAREVLRDELEAAREAKYREIRDAELDFRTGKLSREDYETVDRELRAEAIEILNRLEREEG